MWIVLAVVGIVLLTRGSGHPLNGLGLALALLAGCFWSTYILVNARVGRAFEDSSGLTLAMCVAALAMAPVGIASGGGALAPGAARAGRGGGGASSAIPYSFELEALRRIAAPTFGVLMSLEPAMAALAGFLVLGQSLDARALLGSGAWCSPRWAPRCRRARRRSRCERSRAQAGATSSSTVDCAGTSAEIAPALVLAVALQRFVRR